MAQARLNVQAPIARLMAERWSTRAFDADRPVDAEQLAALLEAARWAPSCFGEQPWRFVVADRFADEAAWRAVLAALAPKNQLWAKSAPVLIVAASMPHFSANDMPNRWREYDTGQAVMQLCLQATALGLASHQMGGFDADAVRTATGIPEACAVMSVTAIGHPAPPEAAPAKFREMETAPRQRKPVEEIAFAGRWGTGWMPPAACGWEARYQETACEQLPWFHAGLDADIARALEETGLKAGRLLDLGCGPGTQAVALAETGFEVTASDISWTAVEAARQRAAETGVSIEAVVDDILQTRLAGPFDVAIDRGVFHCFADDADRARYREAMARLLAPGGWLLLKCFHRNEDRPDGPPGRFDEQDIRQHLGEDFELLRHWDSVFPAPADAPTAGAPPKALFCILRRKHG
ncbi:MAG: nitroreductase family protein [Mariprofundaceae bacterium]